VFRTAEGTKMEAERGSVVVAFQVDDVDPDTSSGCSVLVTGVAQLVTDREALERADALGLESWAVDGGHYVRIDVGLVTGRRIRRPGLVAG
jgi:hypothetical protein